MHKLRSGWILGLTMIVALAWIMTWVKINYPISWDQIGVGYLAWQRGLGFLLIGITLSVLWAKNAKVLVLILVLSPILWAMGMMHTKILLVWCLAVLWQAIFTKTRWKVLGLIVILGAIATLGQGQLRREISLENAKKVVDIRARNQDRSIYEINIPWKIRRLVNNQYVVVFEEWWKNIVGSVDLESLFYSEFHPLSRKNLPIFFWPLIFLVPWGIVKKQAETKQGEIWWNLIAGVMLWGLYDGTFYVRMSLLFFAVAKVLSWGLEYLVEKNYRLAVVEIFLVVYGLSTFIYDFPKRVDYWLDNRPLMYQELYHLLEKYKGKLVVTNLLGNSFEYCKQNRRMACEEVLFGIDKEKVQPGEIVAGFLGELVGTDSNNVFREPTMVSLNKNGYELLETFEVRDAIAFRYGQTIVVAKKI